MQAESAAAIAGGDRLVLVVGPAGTGKTTMLRAATRDLTAHGRTVRGVAPSARAAQVLGQESGMLADTVANLLHEHVRPDRPAPAWRLRAATIVVDEAAMLAKVHLRYGLH